MGISNKKLLNLLFCYLKILGFFPYVYYESGIIKRSKSATIYTTILILGYSINFINVMLSRSSFIRPRETILAVIVDFIGIILEYIAISMIWFYSVTRLRQVQSIVKLFLNTLQCTSVTIKIKITNIYDDIIRQMFILILSLNILFIITVSADFVFCYYEIVDYDFPAWIIFNYPRIIPFNYTMVYIYFLKILHRQFYLLNKSIHYLPEVFPEKDSSSFKIINKKLNPREMDEKLRTFDKLDLNLRDQIKISNKLSSLPLVTVSVLHFIQFIIHLYLLLNVMTKKTFNWSILISVFYLLIRLFTLLYFIDNGNTVCYEANKKVKILHESWALKRPDGFREMLKTISFHQLQEPVEIKLNDALNLNHKLLYKMAGVTTTYLIIMIQLDQQVQHKHNHNL